MKNSVLIRGIKIYSFRSKEDIVDYVKDKNTVLIAVNAEKILHATHEIKGLINQNIGYTDGSGAVWALKRKGLKDTVKIPGCELWLDIISQTYKSKSFYLVGGTEEVIQSTIKKLRSDFEGVNIKGIEMVILRMTKSFRICFKMFVIRSLMLCLLLWVLQSKKRSFLACNLVTLHYTKV